jgi:hypothetical protein
MASTTPPPSGPDPAAHGDPAGDPAHDRTTPGTATVLSH